MVFFYGKKEKISMKATRHNGRSGKHGTYDAKHNKFSLSPGQGRGITYCNDEQVEMVRPLNAYDVIEVGKSQLIFLPLCGEKFQWNEE